MPYSLPYRHLNKRLPYAAVNRVRKSRRGQRRTDRSRPVPTIRLQIAFANPYVETRQCLVSTAAANHDCKSRRGRRRRDKALPCLSHVCKSRRQIAFANQTRRQGIALSLPRWQITFANRGGKSRRGRRADRSRPVPTQRLPTRFENAICNRICQFRRDRSRPVRGAVVNHGGKSRLQIAVRTTRGQVATTITYLKKIFDLIFHFLRNKIGNM